MAVVALLGLLMEACFADFVPQNTPTIFDNGTLLAPNVHGEMVLHTIVDLTWEVDIPNTSNKINITGTANKVIDYINTNHPDYVWPDVSKLNTASLGKTPARRGPKPNCDVFSLAPYPKAHEAQSGLEMIPYTLHLGPGPRTCGQAQCVNDLQGRHAAIWWCNDGEDAAAAKCQEVADLAGIIIPECVEYAAKMSWTRGQIFHDSKPWNVIVNGGEPCG
ncbi:hypothetical protein F5883DRAFT_715466 [Diaporthe sp. PMI_573]|nr:hypothetical protein F5883DRAFT_715466 [Diaporthaceae sp. PMI_573]